MNWKTIFQQRNYKSCGKLNNNRRTVLKLELLKIEESFQLSYLQGNLNSSLCLLNQFRFKKTLGQYHLQRWPKSSDSKLIKASNLLNLSLLEEDWISQNHQKTKLLEYFLWNTWNLTRQAKYQIRLEYGEHLL